MLTAVGRVVERADRLQQRHGVLGFAYAVVRKYADDGGGREAALITYYGFLSIFPALLLGVTAVSRTLADRPDLRHALIGAIVPPALQSTVENAAAAMPSSRGALAAGLIGLLLAGAGVVSGAYRTLNHLAAVRYRLRAGVVSRSVRVFIGLILIVTAAIGVGGLTVVTAALPGLPWASRAVATLGSCLVAFAVLLLVARLLLDRPAPFHALWPAAAPGAVAVTLTLNLGAVVLPGMVRRAGPIYGGFATVTGMFAMLYLLSVALVYAAEIAAVRNAGLWPRALDRTHPTAADARALALLAREQERIECARVESCLLRRPR
jgi:membrane protein